MMHVAGGRFWAIAALGVHSTAPRSEHHTPPGPYLVPYRGVLAASWRPLGAALRAQGASRVATNTPKTLQRLAWTHRKDQLSKKT